MRTAPSPSRSPQVQLPPAHSCPTIPPQLSFPSSIIFSLHRLLVCIFMEANRRSCQPMQQAYISKDSCAVKKLKSSVKSCEVAPIFALHFFPPRQATFPSNGLTPVDGRGNSLEVRDSLMSAQKQ